jgi:hypothetical protein
LGATGVSIVDIPKALSLVNRKSFRSGYIYSVDYIEYIGTAGDVVTVGKVPCSYPALQAYKLGFECWKEQRHEAMGESGIEPGKWSDFKVFYNQDHLDGTYAELNVRGLGTGLVLQALDQTGSEWDRADIVYNDLAAATTTTLRPGMLGANDLAAGYGSLMEAYGHTRVATLSPDPMLPGQASGSWITRTGEASADMTQDVVDVIEAENDTPPYANQTDPALNPTYVGNSQSAPNGMLVDMSVAGTTGRSVTLNGGLIPLGLLAISQAGGASYTLRVHCTPGKYKGAVAALPMGDFN